MTDKTPERELGASFTTCLQVGQEVPDFRLETYDPKTEKFGELSLAALRDAGKWTILFFYPADFTFV